ncbi:MAG: type II secretion system GspH family protein [Puniceicoccales bacterium]|jgi:type II secretory pathway pseudopilin PulG|nr:type II secretion system GspH family protein [Puniceicoccales bacterium]
MFILQNDKTTKRKKYKNKSFTLLEIVFTITIIGILLAICLPAMSAIKLNAQKLKDQSNLQTIAKAWYECAVNRGWTIDGREMDGPNKGTPAISIFVDQLAGRGKTNVSDMVLNDPHIYVSPGDKYASKMIKESVNQFIGGVITYTGLCSGEAIVTNFMTPNGGYILSYCLMMGLPAYAPLNTTPFAFTRGLRIDGKWDEKAGLYGSKGGYVVYCDGHITWFDGSKPAKFLKWDQSGYTSNIREAVPNSTWITCGNPGIETNYTSNGQLVILYHVGTGGD